MCQNSTMGAERVWTALQRGSDAQIFQCTQCCCVVLVSAQDLRQCSRSDAGWGGKAVPTAPHQHECSSCSMIHAHSCLLAGYAVQQGVNRAPGLCSTVLMHHCMPDLVVQCSVMTALACSGSLATHLTLQSAAPGHAAHPLWLSTRCGPQQCSMTWMPGAQTGCTFSDKRLAAEAALNPHFFHISHRYATLSDRRRLVMSWQTVSLVCLKTGT